LGARAEAHLDRDGAELGAHRLEHPASREAASAAQAEGVTARCRVTIGRQGVHFAIAVAHGWLCRKVADLRPPLDTCLRATCSKVLEGRCSTKARLWLIKDFSTVVGLNIQTTGDLK